MKSTIFLVLAFGASLAAAAKVTPAQLTTCKALAKTLNVDVTGATVFCPTNHAFLEFAEELGINGPTALPQLLATVKANPTQFREILNYHIVKGVVPAAKVTNGAVLTTLAPKGTLKVSAKGKSLSLLRPEVDLRDLGLEVADVPPAAAAAAEKSADNDKDEPEVAAKDKAGNAPDGMDSDTIVATDLTFDGPYVPGKSTYIVHAIDGVMIPAAAIPATADAKPAAAAAGAAAASAAAKPAAAAAKPAAVVPTAKPAAAVPAATAKPVAAVGGRKLKL